MLQLKSNTCDTSFVVVIVITVKSNSTFVKTLILMFSGLGQQIKTLTHTLSCLVMQPNTKNRLLKEKKDLK